MKAVAIFLVALAASSPLLVATKAFCAPPPLNCRHPLSVTTSSSDLPPLVAKDLSSWMALHGEPWNDTDSVSPGQLTANFLWATHSAHSWVVAYSVGGYSCCHTRFRLFVGSRVPSFGYWPITPALGGGQPDFFGVATCVGIDAALDTYAADG
jgi:hypothetical protein